MEPIIGIAKSAAGLSNGAVSLIKKIPLLGDIIRYEERKEQTEQVVQDRFLNEYKILNDPVAQTNFINKFSDENERKAIIGHIIDVRSDAQKSLNIANVLNQFCGLCKFLSVKSIIHEKGPSMAYKQKVEFPLPIFGFATN